MGAILKPIGGNIMTEVTNYNQQAVDALKAADKQYSDLALRDGKPVNITEGSNWNPLNWRDNQYVTPVNKDTLETFNAKVEELKAQEEGSMLWNIVSFPFTFTASIFTGLWGIVTDSVNALLSCFSSKEEAAETAKTEK